MIMCLHQRSKLKIDNSHCLLPHLYDSHWRWNIIHEFSLFGIAPSQAFYSAAFPILSGEVISEEYSLEYGTDKMEMHVGAVEAGERALVVDDLIATGGTLNAAIRLLGTLPILSSILFLRQFFLGRIYSVLFFWNIYPSRLKSPFAVIQFFIFSLTFLTSDTRQVKSEVISVCVWERERDLFFSWDIWPCHSLPTI